MSAHGRGPYLFGARVRVLDEAVGRVYLSNGERGEPAVLQVPTGRSAGLRLSPVQVLVTTFGGEGGVAIAVQGEPPPQGVATGVVRDALEAGADLLDSLEHRPDVAGHLSRVRPRTKIEQLPSYPNRLRWLPEIAAAAACALLVWPQATVGVRVQPRTQSEYTWDVPATPASVVHADILNGSSTPEPWSIRKRIVVPNGPMEGQDTPPCRSPSRPLNGGCWLKLEDRPPCPKGAAEHAEVGGCWVPVRGDKPMPVSIGRERGR
ncbi:hypothetical protein JKA73_17820 [Myxococcus xanthus]|uniref:hypothetical protein n=1 Tax=Myxococcus xanthus TaxID=34 RepID=UPI0019179C97|nr:hypothetical protein [Myxococcus xanthus]QQR47793.1 hypothetical protein JKA73_17820 [Myxococcus xanthus]